jgi:hypothetical protein
MLGNQELLGSLQPVRSNRLALLSRVFKCLDGKISKRNTRITIFGNFAKAILAKPNALIGQTSQKYIPTRQRKLAAEWWTKRLKERPWQPGD